MGPLQRLPGPGLVLHPPGPFAETVWLACLLLLSEPAAALGPAELISNTLTMFVLMIVLGVAFVFRHRVLYIFTGDDRVHADWHDVCWGVLTCCRCCTGEWTKWISALCCFWHRGLRGRNLKRAFGQAVGLVAFPARFCNMVVGDLPASTARGDFYVAIEVGESPVQITSVVEDANPKVVQFEETLIARIRNSYMEFPVRITVRQVRAIGMVELCECYLRPRAVARYVRERKGPQRFKMEPLSRSLHLTFPPWILVEIMGQPEWGTPEPFMMPRSFDVTLTELTSQMTSSFRSASNFKRQYQLLTPNGLKSEEPDEDELGQLDELKRTKRMLLLRLFAIGVVVSFFFLLLRFYCLSCLMEYEKVRVLQNFVSEERFPLNDNERNHYLDKCDKQYQPVQKLAAVFFSHSLIGPASVHFTDHNASRNQSQVHANSTHRAQVAQHEGETQASNDSSDVDNRTKAERMVQMQGEVGPTSGKANSNSSASEDEEEPRALTEQGEAVAQHAVWHLAHAVDHTLDAVQPRRLAETDRAHVEAETRRKCNPSLEDVLDTCYDVPFGAPKPKCRLGKLGPLALSIPCTWRACDASLQLDALDFPYFAFLVLWFVASCVIHNYCGIRIHHLETKVHTHY